MSDTGLDLCLALHQAHASLKLRLDDELGTFHGIDFRDFALLHRLALADSGRVALRDLVHPLGLPRSALLRQLLVLEKIGLAARDGEGEERAAVLRPAGRVVTGVATETASRICDEAMRALTSESASLTYETLLALARAPTLALD